MQAELKQMEQVKEEYEKKNQEQSRCIQDFLAEMSILRGEIAAAASLSTQESALRSQLKEETWRREKLEERCKELEQRAEELQERKESTERKLREASVESEQISLSLEEAHTWFQSRFDELQLELLRNKQRNSKHLLGRGGDEVRASPTQGSPTHVPLPLNQGPHPPMHCLSVPCD
ncbi:hypothetical protein FKM82_029104 [Ascaphus truei]